MAVAGKGTYAWRTISEGEWSPPPGYGVVRLYCCFQGMVGCLCFGGLAWFCLSPLL